MSSTSSSDGEDADATVATKTFLHGRLEFYIDRADGLPDTDKFPLALRFADAFGTEKDVIDPFVVGEMGDVSLFETFYLNNTLNPVWDQRFSVPINQEADNIKILLKDKDSLCSQFIASVNFSCHELVQEQRMGGWYELKKDGENRGKIKMSIEFLDDSPF